MVNLRNVCLNLLAVLAAFLVGRASSAVETSIDASKHAGDTCYNMIANEVIPAMIKNENLKFSVPDKGTIEKQAKVTFDPKVIAKVESIFGNPENLGKLIDALQGQTVTPSTFSAVIAKQLETLKLVDAQKIGLDAVSVAPFLGILSGAGVEIVWGDKSISEEYGYKFDNLADKAALAKDVKSGRGFGLSIDRLELDASDSFLLKSGDVFFAKGVDDTLFFKALFDILTQMDTSTLKKLSPQGQALLIDFMTVFVAEFSRAEMTGLNAAKTDFVSHPWEKDLLAVFLLGPYLADAKTISVGRKPVDGNLENFFAVGKAGSGIGETRKDRIDLQQAISAFLVKDAKNNSDLVSRIEALMPNSEIKTDVFQGVIDYLMNPKNQKDIVKNSNEITKIMGELETLIRTDAKDIKTSLEDELKTLGH